MDDMGNKTPAKTLAKTPAKKIVALSCSPSKGRNSDSMLDNFIIGVEKNGGAEIKKFYLNDIKIDLYTYENGKSPQLHEKEFANLVEEIKTADGLVIATPTYNFSVPAQLKNFIDRIRFVALDLNKKNKIGQPTGMLGNLGLFFIVSGGIPTWAEKILFFAFPPFYLRGVFLYFGARVYDAIYSGDIRTFENEKILKKCRKKGEKYAKKIINCRGNSLLERIFWRPPQREA